MLATASNGEGLCDINLSRKSLLVLLYSPIISAIGNVMDLMVGTSEFVGIEPAQGACQPDKPVRYLLPDDEVVPFQMVNPCL